MSFEKSHDQALEFVCGPDERLDVLIIVLWLCIALLALLLESVIWINLILTLIVASVFVGLSIRARVQTRSQLRIFPDGKVLILATTSEWKPCELLQGHWTGSRYIVLKLCNEDTTQNILISRNSQNRGDFRLLLSWVRYRFNNTNRDGSQLS